MMITFKILEKLKIHFFHAEEQLAAPTIANCGVGKEWGGVRNWTT
jgi:hypothetical protein